MLHPQPTAWEPVPDLGAQLGASAGYSSYQSPGTSWEHNLFRSPGFAGWHLRGVGGVFDIVLGRDRC